MRGMVGLLSDRCRSILGSVGIRVRILLTLAALGTLLYTVGAPHEHGG